MCKCLSVSKINIGKRRPGSAPGSGACPGTDCPARHLSREASTSRTHSGSCRPRPTSTKVPTMARTMLRRKRLAVTVNTRYNGAVSGAPAVASAGTVPDTGASPAAGAANGSGCTTGIGAMAGVQQLHPAAVTSQRGDVAALPVFSKQLKSCCPSSSSAPRFMASTSRGYLQYQEKSCTNGSFRPWM